MQPQKIHSCLERYQQVQRALPESPKLLGKTLTEGEVFTVDDYQSLGFKGYNNKNRQNEDITKWAGDVKSLAKSSINFHLAEVPLKILSHIINKTQDKEGLLPRTFFVLERVADSLGGMFRNNIYAHEDKNKNQDDNLGAEKFAKEKFGDGTTHGIAVVNNYYQTMGRFLIPVIGAFNSQLANELDWVVGGTLDAIRWKRTASNSAFYPGFLHDVFHAITGGTELKPILNFASSKFKQHWTDTKTAWKLYFSSPNQDKKEKKANLTSFYKGMDQLTSAFLSLSQWPNIIGDILRPVARRFEWTGAARNIVRLLSVIDRPFIWINYIFRFYLPERIAEERSDARQSNFNYSNLLPLAIGGDILDFGTTLLQDKVKEVSPFLEESLNIIGIVKGSFFKMFFSGRRERIANQTLNESK